MLSFFVNLISLLLYHVFAYYLKLGKDANDLEAIKEFEYTTNTPEIAILSKCSLFLDGWKYLSRFATFQAREKGIPK